jgi:hypothetical protein
MRINYKNWPVLKGLKDFDTIKSIPFNVDLKNFPCDYFIENDFTYNITCVRKTFENDAHKNHDKLWSLFVNDIWNNEDCKVAFEHTGIMLKSNHAIWYSFSKKTKTLLINAFLDNGIYIGTVACLSDNIQIKNELSVKIQLNEHLKGRDNTIDYEVFSGVFETTIVNVMFKQFANVETKHLKPNEKHVDKKLGHKDLNETDFDITILDSTWYTNLIRSEGFKVTGHPRLQPCKEDGEWTYKLI